MSVPLCLKVFAACEFSDVSKSRTGRFTRAKTPRTPSLERFSFAAFAPLREIFRVLVGLGRAEYGYTENWLLSISETNILMS
jgi:hypothetical protein